MEPALLRIGKDAFGATPDTSFYFPSRSHRAAFQDLTHAIDCDRPFAVLVGKPGTGKTTLLFRILEQYRKTARTVFVFQSQCNARELMQYLLADSDIDASTQDIVTLHARFNEILIDAYRSGKRFLLVLDEAHNFDEATIESIRLLSDFETPKKKLVQIIFSGQPALDDVLARPAMLQVKQRISLFRTLEPLSHEEVNEYVAHRLKVVGAGLEIFSTMSLELIADLTGGIPREIHNMCFAALSLASAQGRPKVTCDVVYTVAHDLRIHSGDEKYQEEKIVDEASIVERDRSDGRDGNANHIEIVKPAKSAETIEAPLASSAPAASSHEEDQPAIPIAVAKTPKPDPTPEFFEVQRPIVPDAADNRKQVVTSSNGKSFESRDSSPSEPKSGPRNANGKKIFMAAAVLGIVSGCAVFAWVQGVNEKVKALASGQPLLANTASQAAAGTSEETARKPVVAVMPRPPTKKRTIRKIASEAANRSTELVDREREIRSPTDDPDLAMAVAGTETDSKSNDQLADALTPSVSTVSAAPTPAPAPEPSPPVSRFVLSKLIESPPPTYPSAARNARIGGQVELEAIITTQGKLRDIHVIKGHPLLNAAAIDAAKRQRYTPYLLNGVPQEVSTRVRFVFKP